MTEAMDGSARRILTAMTLLACMGLAACATSSETATPPGLQPAAPAIAPPPPVEQASASVAPPRIGPKPNERFPVPDESQVKIAEKYQRQLVDYQTAYAPGTIVVDPANHFLYLVQANGKALRYGVGVGAAGRGFSGETDLAWKQEWPRWRPTDAMIARAPQQYKKYEDGVEGGPTNPLGARALYLFKDGKDTYYRIHGTNQPSSIGKSVSAGCIRLLNSDIIDLYARARPGSKVVIL
ncbi:L,D-transpeptidase [Aquamicrobium lusatiense]|uniref:L,D-transpeptidase n=1 Tax=Aquamicrobium TaxID=69278 RepID=UPI002453BEA5|nr:MULTISPECIES: L,D-transpeptidase [Aquamicrobium]MCK9551099.1 L,D-transpeptidase [Aquamicrobium sp.]MDH4991151.1 L,D-transpeptidase [Aquamicrobium lusatiense]